MRGLSLIHICTRVVAVQRSRGYSSRPSLMPEDVAPLAEMLKRDFPDAVLMVDNCCLLYTSRCV